jgi:hypothetical protein
MFRLSKFALMYSCYYMCGTCLFWIARLNDCILCTKRLSCCLQRYIFFADCPVNFYCTSGSVVPVECPISTNCPAKSSSPFPCPAGFYCPGHVGAIICPLGSFCPTNSVQGVLCPAGSFGPVAGLMDAANCSASPKGTFSPISGLTVPQPCAPGYICPAAGLSTLIPCPVGYFCSSSGLSAGVPCPGGSFSAATGLQQAASCLPCSIGTFSSTLGATSSSVCKSCDMGFYCPATGLSNPLPCAAGAYSSYVGLSSPALCTPCPIGTFSSTSGRTSSDACQPCTKGSFCSTPGISLGLNCSAGRYANSTGLSECFSCQVGKYSSLSSQTACVSCAVGTASETSGATHCSTCTSGRYSAQPGLSSCVNCIAGTFAAASGLSFCSACSCVADRGSCGPQSGLCSCYVGFDGPTCSVCAAGYMPPDCIPPCAKHSDCATCASDTGLGCAWCASSMTCNPSSASSAYCVSDKTVSSAGSCCSPGGVVVGTSCRSCGPGRYSTSAGAGDCTLCSPGTSVSYSGATACTACAVDTYASTSGNSVCTPCGSNSYTSNVGSSSKSNCFTCATGQGVDRKSGSCSDCPPGKYGLNGLPCRNCKKGTYQEYYSQSSCNECPPGSSSEDAASSCLQCLKGSYSALSGENIACSECPKGTYSASMGATACLLCPTGTFSKATGAVACEKCPAGSSCAVGAVMSTPTTQQGDVTAVFTSSQNWLSGALKSSPPGFSQLLPFSDSNTSTMKIINGHHQLSRDLAGAAAVAAASPTSAVRLSNKILTAPVDSSSLRWIIIFSVLFSIIASVCIVLTVLYYLHHDAFVTTIHLLRNIDYVYYWYQKKESNVVHKKQTVITGAITVLLIMFVIGVAFGLSSTFLLSNIKVQQQPTVDLSASTQTSFSLIIVLNGLSTSCTVNDALQGPCGAHISLPVSWIGLPSWTQYQCMYNAELSSCAIFASMKSPAMPPASFSVQMTLEDANYKINYAPVTAHSAYVGIGINGPNVGEMSVFQYALLPSSSDIISTGYNESIQLGVNVIAVTFDDTLVSNQKPRSGYHIGVQACSFAF